MMVMAKAGIATTNNGVIHRYFSNLLITEDDRMFSSRSASGCGPDSMAMNALRRLWKLEVVNRNERLRPTQQCLVKKADNCKRSCFDENRRLISSSNKFSKNRNCRTFVDALLIFEGPS